MAPKEAVSPPAAPHATSQQPPAAQPVTTGATQLLILPTLVFGVVEIHRLQRELEALEEYMQQASLRKDASKNPEALPRISRLLDALASENSCNLLKKAERDRLSIFLRTVSESAPTIHMSFATDPSAAFTAKVVSWLRINIHPLVLLQLGLQPSIAAGTIIRTTNHVFDLSLRRHFDAQKAQLIVSLEGSAK